MQFGTNWQPTTTLVQLFILQVYLSVFKMVSLPGEDSNPSLQDILVPWRFPEHQTYVFLHANVVDPVKGEVITNCRVRISRGRIESIDQGEPDVDTHSGVQVVDLEGRFLCPGLIDCHVHLAAVPGDASLRSIKDLSPSQSLLRQPFTCKAILDRGFTTVRDCGGAFLAIKEAIQQGIHPGPRLFIAGHALSQSGGHGDHRAQHDSYECCGGSAHGIGRIVDGVEQCLKFAREEFRQGSDFIKIMAGGGVASPTDAIEHVQFTADEVKAIVTVAQNVGSYVTAHAYTPQAIRQCIRQGVRAIEHGNLIDEPTAREMAERNVYLTPTLVTYASFAYEKYSSFLPPASMRKNYEVLQDGLKAMKVAFDAGVKICFGTDLLGPLQFAQTREFTIRSQVLPAVEILRSATVTAAELLNQQDFLGQIKPGFAADLIILASNPLDDITSLDRPDSNLLAVIKDGRVVSTKLPQIC